MASGFASRLSARGFKADVVGDIGVYETMADFKKDDGDNQRYAHKDYRHFGHSGIERLLVLRVAGIGTKRGYYGFIPMGSPVAFFSVQGQLIDLKSNRILWDKIIVTTKPIATPWDQEPDYPNLIDAVAANAVSGVASLEHQFFVTTNAETLSDAEMTIPVTSAPAAPPAPKAPTAIRPAAPVTPVAAVVPAAPAPAPVPMPAAPAQPAVVYAAPAAVSAPVAVQPTPVSSIAAPHEFKIGQSSGTVEDMIRERGCSVRQGAELLSSEGPVEIYRAQCVDGRVMQARWEFRQCRLQ